MKISPEHVKMFQSLQNTATGTLLVDFFEKLLDDLCDVRKLGDCSKEDITARVGLSKLIESEFTGRIRLSNTDVENHNKKYI